MAAPDTVSDDDDDKCPKTGKRHIPDWKSVTVEYDVETYIDINCKDCGRSGCIGNEKTLTEGICW